MGTINLLVFQMKFGVHRLTLKQNSHGEYICLAIDTPFIFTNLSITS